MLTRRGVLGLLAGAALDPERALWTPKRYVQGVTLANPRIDLNSPFLIWRETISQDEFRKRWPEASPEQYFWFEHHPAVKLYPQPSPGDTLRVDYGALHEFWTFEGVGWRRRIC